MKKCCGVHTLRIAVGITMLGLLLASSANAANLKVCPADAMGDYGCHAVMKKWENET